MYISSVLLLEEQFMQFFDVSPIFLPRRIAGLERQWFHILDESLTELSSKLVKAEIIPLISSNSLSGFLWTINNYTGSKPTSWQCRYAGVVGAIDGTHIKIIAPSKDEDVFVNRKKVHYINMQIAFDATFNILDVAKWPGSTHDSRILMESVFFLRGTMYQLGVTCWVTAAIPARRLDTSQSTTGSTVKV
ncbi:putative nuclease HARBI1 [Merluccius polli]|uniref:Nuclease HARBI1 n=1 Tax=Merluccius polli TaxID=89951 RepID=A0AA47MU69_MERPO|nr:putative nuclease HARBI1 [Merluccius polli]